MRWTDLVPEGLKPYLRPLWRLYETTPWLHPRAFRSRTREEFHQYWAHNTDGSSTELLASGPRSVLITRLIGKFAPRDAKILEIGCDGGGNLDYLYRSGFRRLTGLEINSDALAALRSAHPEMAAHIRLCEGSIEERIKTFLDDEFDVVFTLGVLGCVHRDCEWVFADMVRITNNLLISIDYRKTKTSWIVARDYQRVFESLGMRLIDRPSLDGLADEHYVSALVFKKAQPGS